VLALNAKLRALVVPQEAEAPAQAVPPADCEANCAYHRPVRLSWAKLLKRVFELDLEHCPSFGGDDRQSPEQLCRYITRPALANERVQTNAAG